MVRYCARSYTGCVRGLNTIVKATYPPLTPLQRPFTYNHTSGIYIIGSLRLQQVWVLRIDCIGMNI